MKRTTTTILSAILMLLSSLSLPAQTTESSLFPYPQPPEEMTNFYQRCTYLVYHFWDRCNFGNAFLHKQKLDDAFTDWIGFMPYAQADTVHMAVDGLLQKVKKSGPNTLDLAKMAEARLWSDSATIISDEVYLPFAKAAANHSKISKAERARFAAQARQIENSSVGAQLPPMTLTATDGSKSLLSDIQAKNIIVFFNDPDCSDCNLARVRLSADYNCSKLIEKGLVKIVSIYPGEPDDAVWLAAAASYPDNWLVVAAPDSDEYFDLRTTPAIYYAGPDGKIKAKNVIVDNLLNALEILGKKNM